MSQHFQLDDQLMFFLKAQCTTVVGGREIQGETQTHTVMVTSTKSNQ